MYGFFDPHLIYGFREECRDVELNERWLENYLKKHDLVHVIQVFFTDAVRNYGGSAIYGCLAEFDCVTGQATIHPEVKKAIEKLYEHLKKTSKHQYSPLSFHLGLSGDLGNCHAFYQPAEVKEKEEGEEEEGEEEEEA